MPDELRPPPESAHFEFHWLRLTGEKSSTLCPVAWNSSDGGYWDDEGKRWDGVASYKGLVWSYSHPCDPAALTINPDDPELIKRMARAICASYGDDFDEQPIDLATLRQDRWEKEGREVHSHDPGLPTQSDWMDAARAALKTLFDRHS